jgi:hypothetical protein
MLAVAFTFGASTELVVTESVFGAIGLAVALAFCDPGLRARLVRGIGWVAAGGAAGVVLSIPVIYAALDTGIPKTAPNPPKFYSSDLANVLAPTRMFSYGETRFAALWQHWLVNDAENTAYLPLPLLLFLVAYMVASNGRRSAALFTYGLIALVLSFGPYLIINGTFTIPMPWWVLEQLPAIDHALPGRFSAFVFMAVCLLVAQAWTTRAIPRPLIGATVAASMFLLVPNFTAMAFPTREMNRSFVASGAYESVIAPDENVLVLPVGQWGPGMAWVVDSDFAFRMPTGNGGGAAPPPQLTDPVGAALFYQDLTFDFTSTLPGFVDRYGVDTVLVPETATDYVAIATAAFGPPDQTVEHVLVWQDV